ncbi:Glyoxylate/hydroxypyruvate reductase B [compost metagenome]
MLRLNASLGRHRVLVTRPVPEQVVERLDTYFEVELCDGERPLRREELLSRLRQKVGVMICATDAIDADMLRELRSLKAVCAMTEACDQVDLLALTQAGVMVTNAPKNADARCPAHDVELEDSYAYVAAENLIAAFGFGRIGGRPANLLNPELLCDCC